MRCEWESTRAGSNKWSRTIFDRAATSDAKRFDPNLPSRSEGSGKVDLARLTQRGHVALQTCDFGLGFTTAHHLGGS